MASEKGSTIVNANENWQSIQAELAEAAPYCEWNNGQLDCGGRVDKLEQRKNALAQKIQEESCLMNVSYSVHVNPGKKHWSHASGVDLCWLWR